MAAAEDGHTFSPLLRGQERELGNLYAEVPAMARKGKAQFDELFAAGRAHRDDDSHQPALECFGSAYVMARELHYRLGEAMALEQAALVYSTLGDQSRAIEMLSAAVRLFEMASDVGGLVTSLLNLGEVHTQLEQMGKAAEVLARGRAAASRLHCPELELAAIVKGAIVELRRNHPSEALSLLGQALGIAVALGDATEEVFIASIVSLPLLPSTTAPRHSASLSGCTGPNPSATGCGAQQDRRGVPTCCLQHSRHRGGRSGTIRRHDGPRTPEERMHPRG